MRGLRPSTSRGTVTGLGGRWFERQARHGLITGRESEIQRTEREICKRLTKPMTSHSLLYAVHGERRTKVATLKLEGVVID